MQLSSNQLSEIADVACEAARSAGAMIRAYTGGEVEVQYKEGGDSLASQVVTEVDERSQSILLDGLKATSERYDLGLLTEELPDDGSRFVKDYFWCIDPLDGTLPFTQGRPGYAVSIALVTRAGQAVIGVTYDPVQERLYRAVTQQGLKINGQPFVPKAADSEISTQLRFSMDCTFETDTNQEAIRKQASALATELGFAEAVVEVRGGAVCNACYVLEHASAVYLKAPKSELGGGCSWDFAATACIFEEAGASVSDYTGADLVLNSREHTFFNHCGVCFCSDIHLARKLQGAL